MHLFYDDISPFIIDTRTVGPRNYRLSAYILQPSKYSKPEDRGLQVA